MNNPPETPYIMEERNSSFVEIQMTPKDTTRKSRASKRSAGDRHSHSQSPSVMRVSGATRHSAVVYTEEDAHAMILKANSPPNYNGGFDGMLSACLLFVATSAPLIQGCVA